MEYRSAKGFTGWGQIGVLFAFFGVGLVVASIIQVGIIAFFTDGNFLKATGKYGLMKLLENPTVLKLSQVTSVVLIMFMPSVAYLRLCHGKSWKWLGFFKQLNIAQLVLGFAIIFCSNLFAGLFTEFTKKMLAYWPSLASKAQQMELTYYKQIAAMGTAEGWSGYILLLLIIAVLPALLEEMLFRGVLQNLLTRWWKKPLLAITITSIIFSLVHVSYYNFLSRFILGFALGWMFYVSRNIWINIVAHFFNNALAVTQLFLLSKNNKPVNANSLDEKVPLIVSLLMGLVLVGVCYLFLKASAKSRIKIMLEEEALHPIYDVHRPISMNHETV
jgi:hypothetical protein